MAQTLNDIKTLLQAHGLAPKKRFGQNFLHDANHLERILNAVSIDDHHGNCQILEVGPGTGALTERMLEKGHDVLAVEIDTDMQPILQQRCAEPFAKQFEVVFGDALDGKHHLHPAILEKLAGKSFRLVANLPYNAASPIMIIPYKFCKLIGDNRSVRLPPSTAFTVFAACSRCKAASLHRRSFQSTKKMRTFVPRLSSASSRPIKASVAACRALSASARLPLLTSTYL